MYKRQTWSIDLHFPDSVNSVRFPGNEFKSATVHRWIHPDAVPYRCLYSVSYTHLSNGKQIEIAHRWKNFGWGYCPTNIPQWKNKYKVAFALLDTKNDKPKYVFVEMCIRDRCNNHFEK